MNDSEHLVHAGSHDDYEWLVVRDNGADVLALCPDVAVGKYVAITSFDSGPLVLNEDDKSAGWTTNGGVAYSPKIQDVDSVPREYFSEFYIFESQRDLGELADRSKNIFECQMQPRQVYTFVNFDFGFHEPDSACLADMFWQQFRWINPESYLAENDWLIFVTKNHNLFTSVHEALRRS